MPRVSYRQPDGSVCTIDVAVGRSVMEGAVKHGVKGIEAECGGSCACATCHVYIDADWLAKLPPAAAMETDMLECTAEPAAPTSRLSCQIRVTAELEGLIVQLPTTQI